MQSILRAQKNVAEEKPTKGFSPTGFFWSPSRRKAAKQLPFVICRTPFFQFLYSILFP